MVTELSVYYNNSFWKINIPLCVKLLLSYQRNNDCSEIAEGSQSYPQAPCCQWSRRGVDCRPSDARQVFAVRKWRRHCSRTAAAGMQRLWCGPKNLRERLFLVLSHVRREQNIKANSRMLRRLMKSWPFLESSQATVSCGTADGSGSSGERARWGDPGGRRAVLVPLWTQGSDRSIVHEGSQGSCEQSWNQ